VIADETHSARRRKRERIGARIRVINIEMIQSNGVVIEGDRSDAQIRSASDAITNGAASTRAGKTAVGVCTCCIAGATTVVDLAFVHVNAIDPVARITSFATVALVV